MTDVATSTATQTRTLAQPMIQLQQSSFHIAPSNPLSKLSATEALSLFSSSLETLVHATGEVPPTPPPRTPTDPQMTGLQFEKDVIAKSSPSRTPTKRTESQQRDLSRVRAYSAAMTREICAVQQEAIDGVRLKTNSSSPPANFECDPIHHVITADEEPLNAQHGAITRKFYSKAEPPISITQYLQRLHQFCPMSTAVYLAASLYIYRLTVEQCAISVTRKNVHRLVLAALRVATKALEDLAYPHAKVAKVGGVSEAELARLEISFCFLAGFELVIGEEGLRAHYEALRAGVATTDVGGQGIPMLKLKRPPRGMPTPEERG